MEATTIARTTRQDSAFTTYRPFRTAAVLGAGTMGAQIAAHLANVGLEVELLDIAADEKNRNAVVEKQFKKAMKLRPDPFFTGRAQRRIRTGNFEDHFERVGKVDWVIEAVVERLDIKREVMARVEEVVGEGAVISTNTSGIPIAEIAAERSEDFKRRFLGTHFFNPPRYLKLLEVIPTAHTAGDVVERVAHFGRMHLGKGIVVAKDVPYFIGNRIGIYAMMQALSYFLEGEYTIEEIDALTGTLVGRPKSATFRTADVVGLDVMLDVTATLYEKTPHDESREAFRAPELLRRLVEEGRLGAKTKAGFYKKVEGEIRSVNPATLEYESPAEVELGDLGAIKDAGGTEERQRKLFENEGRAGRFFRETMLDLLAYSARRIPEITDSPANIDRALRWGFGWEIGPFETWDALGFEHVIEAMEEEGIALPDWVRSMRRHGNTTFYREHQGRRQVYVPEEGAYQDDPRPVDVIELAAVKTDNERTLWKSAEAALLDIGEGVGLFEFRSKSNSLGQEVVQGLAEVIGRVEEDPNLRGLVIGNEGKNFSVGANLGEMAMAAAQGEFETIERFLKGFQETIQRVRYAAKPVVVAPHQRTLGGGCEMTIACPHPVASAETYIGLVELGVGLIPAGTGTMRMVAKAARGTPNGYESEILPALQKYFENIAMAEVATSAPMAKEMGYLPEHARVVMDDGRRLYVAREEVIRLSNEGYLPPPVEMDVKVLGRNGFAALEVGIDQYFEGGFISEYDRHLALKLARVMTGGELSYAQEVHEDYLLELEREVFMSLIGEEKTMERIMHILEHNKPLRN